MIQFPSHLSGLNRTDAFSNPPAPKAPAQNNQAATGDRLSSPSTESLRQALARTSEIRPEVVARGKALAVDVNYPPRQLIESLSKLMLESKDLST